jgi:hypothetical protein
MKEIIDKLDFTEIKNFCSTNEHVKRMIRHRTDEDIQKDISDKELLPKMYKFNNKKAND